MSMVMHVHIQNWSYISAVTTCDLTKPDIISKFMSEPCLAHLVPMGPDGFRSGILALVYTSHILQTRHKRLSLTCQRKVALINLIKEFKGKLK